MTEAGTLWLDYPSRGGPSPEVLVSVEPESAVYFYQHSLFVKGGSGWPWVAGSGVERAKAISVSGLRPATYAVRLYFADPIHDKPDQRVFAVELNGKMAEENLDVARESGGRMRSLVRQFDAIKSDGELQIVLTPTTGHSILCGLEIVAQGLQMDEFRIESTGR